MKELLSELNVINEQSIEKIADRTRDMENLPVFQCTASDVIFLGSHEHIAENYYHQKNVPNDTLVPTSAILDDATRRFSMFEKYIKDASYLDVGSGEGGILSLAKGVAKSVAGVELNRGQRERCLAADISVYDHIDKAGPDNHYDVISLFHVLEHLTQPLDMLKRIYQLLKPGGCLIVEVPHARDFLLSTLDCEPFKNFTFWAEHLVLHTRESLKKFLEVAGFISVKLSGVQRYGLSNHLYWLRHHAPGGHAYWAFLESSSLQQAYESKLSQLDQTDTIMAISRKPV